MKQKKVKTKKRTSDAKAEVIFRLNGKEVTCIIREGAVLLDVIRDVFLLKGTKPGCHEGECGACTVLVDDVPVNSCLFLAVNVEGKKVQTIEGLAMGNGTLHAVQDALVSEGAVQCGFCTSGMAMAIKGLQVKYNPSRNTSGKITTGKPSREEIKKWLEGNLCRCTGYVKIIDAAEKLLRK